jgi:hypothetical protein
MLTYISQSILDFFKSYREQAQAQDTRSTSLFPTYKNHLTPPAESDVDIVIPSPYFPALQSTRKLVDVYVSGINYEGTGKLADVYVSHIINKGICVMVSGKFFLCGNGGKFVMAENFSLPRLAEKLRVQK